MIELASKILGWWLVITILASILSACAYPLVRRWIAGLGHSSRSLVRLAYAGSAPVAALLVVVVATQPTFVNSLIPAHCHGIQCGPHSPVIAGNSLILTGLASLCSLLFILLMAMVLWALGRVQQRLHLLRAFTRQSDKGFLTLESEQIVACCVGLWRPQIVLSRGLIEGLEPDELSIVLAHERAHVARLDNLRFFLLRWFTLAWPASLRRLVCGDSRIDAEHVCDLAAAGTVAGAQRVAAVISKLAALSNGAVGTRASQVVGFDCDDPTSRLTLLARCGRDESTSGNLLKAGGCLSLNWCIQIYLLTSVSHKLIEWVALTTA